MHGTVFLPTSSLWASWPLDRRLFGRWVYEMSNEKEEEYPEAPFPFVVAFRN